MLLSLIISLFFATGCGNGDKITTTMDYDELIYRFHDSSVPPKYHRSYTITVNHSEITKVVDSYGDVISTTTNPIEDGAFDLIKKKFTKAGIKKCESDNGANAVDDGCTGGTGESISCSLNGIKVFSAYVGHCGGVDTGDLCGDCGMLQSALSDLITAENLLDE